jgi:hypothetical protein
VVCAAVGGNTPFSMSFLTNGLGDLKFAPFLEQVRAARVKK